MSMPEAGNRPDVALVTALYPPSVGGIQGHVRALAGALAHAGARVAVLTRAVPGAPAQEGDRVLQVRRLGAATGNAAVRMATFVAAAASALVSLRPRAVHAHQLLSPATAALLARRSLRAPLLLNPHACGPIGDVGQLRAQGRVGQARLRAAVEEADGFVAINRPIEQELLSAGASPEKVFRVENGVDLRRFHPAEPGEKGRVRGAFGIPRDVPLVACFGRLSPEKGVDVLLRALPLLLQLVPGTRLWLVGDGPSRPSLEGLALELGLGHAVHFAGAVEDPAPAWRAADAAALPSHTEGLPLALLEAMASGIPVVATAVGGTPEVLDGGAGTLVQPGNAEALARALAWALTRGEAHVRAARARAVVDARYGLAAVAARHLALYEALGRARA